MFVNGGQTSAPFQGVGITTTTKVDRDIIYSLSGKGVDAVIIDTGVSVLHPEFIADDGTYRVRDVILDGPYKVDPAAFSGYTETVTIDGVKYWNSCTGSKSTFLVVKYFSKVCSISKFRNSFNISFIYKNTSTQ